jgi:thiol-disulfide isomerase/thioredoxin
MKTSYKILLILALAISFQTYCYSQEPGKIPAAQKKDVFLHVGDKIPDDVYAASNYGTSKLRFSELRGKLILLDLWGVHCGACIEHMPDVEDMQTKFGDKIQVIMVTENTGSEVKKLSARSENVKNNHLPFINGEQKLAGLFDYKYIPTHVWIDGSGIIRYITDGQHTTPVNISAFLAGRALNFNERKDISIGSNNRPLFLDYYPYLQNKFYIYSFLAPADDSLYRIGGIESDGGLDIKGKHKTQYGTGYSFKNLYKMAYGHSLVRDPFSDSRVFNDFKDIEGYADKSYIYDIEVNENMPGERIRHYIQAQLDVFFNVRSSIKKRMVPCLVIRKIDNGNNCFTNKTDTNRFAVVAKTHLKATMPWGKFVSYIDGRYFETPYQVLDETGISRQKIIDLEMSIKFNALDEVRKSLVPFGLTITKEDRLMDAIVIEDADQ